MYSKNKDFDLDLLFVVSYRMILAEETFVLVLCNIKQNARPFSGISLDFISMDCKNLVKFDFQYSGSSVNC